MLCLADPSLSAQTVTGFSSTRDVIPYPPHDGPRGEPSWAYLRHSKTEPIVF